MIELVAVAVAACLYTPVDTDAYLFERYERATLIDNSGAYRWKDEEAARARGMGLKQYVIGGLEPRFKKSLRRIIEAMELRNIVVSFNSGYRDALRQKLVDGSKNPVNLTFHGGTRLPYGQALAADLMGPWGPSEKERLALARPAHDFIDKHGGSFGIGRPFGSGDPPHVTPTWSREYTAHHRSTSTQSARRHHKKHRAPPATQPVYVADYH